MEFHVCQKNMVQLQVFDEDDKEESSAPEPIANVGQAHAVLTMKHACYFRNYFQPNFNSFFKNACADWWITKLVAMMMKWYQKMKT